MSMPYGSTEEPEVEIAGERSIPVHVVSTGAKSEKSIGAEYGRWRTLVVSNVIGQSSITPGAQRLLNRSLRRHRALILVQPSIVAQAVLDGVLIGGREEITSGQPAVPGNLGGYLQIGTSLRYEAQSELWVCYPSTNTNTVYVSVCDEVYASNPESWREK